MLERVPLASEVIVLCWETPVTSERNARKIAEFLGAKARFVSLATAALSGVDSIRKLVPSCACLIAHVETLARAADAMETGVNGLRVLIDLAEHVFIHGREVKEPSRQDLLIDRYKPKSQR